MGRRVHYPIYVSRVVGLGTSALETTPARPIDARATGGKLLRLPDAPPAPAQAADGRVRPPEYSVGSREVRKLLSRSRSARFG